MSHNNKMELPKELWQLIAYNLKFELDLYKYCSLVNKQLCHIIKQIYDKIPNDIVIDTIYNEYGRTIQARNEVYGNFEPIDMDTIKIINEEYYNYYSCRHINYHDFPMHTMWICLPYTLSKNMLLTQKEIVVIFNRDKYTFKLSSKIENFIDNNLCQKCRCICFQNWIGMMKVTYCENISQLTLKPF